MKPTVSDHPANPFRPEITRTFPGRALAFLDGPISGSPDQTLLIEFLGLIHTFAFLERIVQGQVLCELPVHVERVLAGIEGPGAEGELLAAREAGLLDWTPESADNLVDALDEIGVKVFCRDDPEDGPPPESPRVGAFAFEGDSGPAFLVGATRHTPEGAYIAAHQLGHLSADVDPYRPRLCRWHAQTWSNLSGRPEEERADRFARALLMPRDAFLEALHELEGRTAEGEDVRAAQLAALFAVPLPIVFRRLEDLDLPELPVTPGEDRSAAAAGRLPVAPSDGPEVTTQGGAELNATAGREVDAVLRPIPAVSLTLPERFVNLALAAYAGRVLELGDLARFLRAEPEDALRMAEFAGVSPEPRDAPY